MACYVVVVLFASQRPLRLMSRALLPLIWREFRGNLINSNGTLNNSWRQFASQLLFITTRRQRAMITAGIFTRTCWRRPRVGVEARTQTFNGFITGWLLAPAGGTRAEPP